MDHIDQYIIKDNGIFPGNSLPVLVYKKALKVPWFFAAKKIKELLSKNNWSNNWRNGIYTYHHYHSTTHEAMAVIKGRSVLLMGGENGKLIVIERRYHRYSGGCCT